MPRERRGARRVGLTSPQILVPAVVGLALVAILLVGGLAGGGSPVPRPSETRTYDDFSQAIREFEVESVQMYRDTLYVTPRGGPAYLVQDVSPEYTVGLLAKFKVPLKGIPQPSPAGPMLSAGILVAVMLPYLFLGWLTVMMVRAAAGAADLDPEALGEESRCPECSRPVSRNSRFCQHCAHPVQSAGPLRECPGCGEQVWRSDRHCRSCGQGLPTPPLEARRARPEGPVPATPASRPPEPRAEAGGHADFDPGAPVASPLRRDRSGRPPTPGPFPGERGA